MKRSFKIFILLVFLILSLPLFAKDQNHSSIAKEKELTIEQYQEAESTIGNPDSELYDETAFAVILEKALAGNLLDEADELRASYRLEMAAKNKPGSTAADFRFKLRPSSLCHSTANSANNSYNLSKAGNGEEDSLNLYDVSSDKPILLMFYDPDCGHCMETIKELSVSTLQDKLTIIAIDAEEDREGWLETLSDIPESWTVGFALDPIQDDETYIFVTSPSIYLLSPDKKVILKDTRLNRIEEYLSAN